MSAGAGYDKIRCTVLKQTGTTDDAGSTTVTFTEVAGLVRIPCGFRPDRGWERSEDDHKQSTLMGTLRIRSCAAVRAVKADHIVEIDFGTGTKRFNIKYVANLDRDNRFEHFTVLTGGPDE